MPPRGEDAAPVAPGEVGELLLVEAGGGERGKQLRQAGDVAELGRDRGAVEIGAEGDVARPDPVGDVAGVVGDQGQRGVGVVGEVRAQERRREDDPDEAVAGGDRVELGVGEVARGGADRVGARVAGDQRPGLELGDVPEAGLVQVAEVDEDAELGAGTDQRPAGVGQPRADVGRGGEGELDAGREGVGTAPDRAEAAQPGGVPVLERLEAGVDRLGALERENGDRR